VALRASPKTIIPSSPDMQFLARDSMLSALYAIARPSVRLSVRPSVRPPVTRVDQSTRKLCCRKDDRAMRPIGYMDSLNFRDSLTTPTATIPNIFMVFCSDRPYECSDKI